MLLRWRRQTPMKRAYLEKMRLPISRVLSWTIIHLGQMSPFSSSNLPESSASNAMGFLFGLAPSGVYHRHELLPVMRCALTAPFHPYRSAIADLGGSLSAALSVDFRLPGITWHSALWSPDFPLYTNVYSDCLASTRQRYYGTCFFSRNS